MKALHAVTVTCWLLLMFRSLWWSAGLTFSVFILQRRCDAMLDIILPGYIWLWYLWLVSNTYLWNNLWSVCFKTSGWEIKFHYMYLCSFWVICVFPFAGGIWCHWSYKTSLPELLHKCPLNDTNCWHLWIWEAVTILLSLLKRKK